MRGPTFRWGAWASHCSGFSCCRAQSLGSTASVAVAHGLSSCGSWALEHGLSSCGEWVYLLYGIQNLPGTAIKLMAPALTGGFLSTATMEVLICIYFSLEENCLWYCVDFCHITTWISQPSVQSLSHVWLFATITLLSDAKQKYQKTGAWIFFSIFFNKWIGFFYCLEAYSIFFLSVIILLNFLLSVSFLDTTCLLSLKIKVFLYSIKVWGHTFTFSVFDVYTSF